MKKIFLSTLLFVILFAMSIENSTASCPSGYTSASFTIADYGGISGCNVTVEYCYKCSPSSNGLQITLDRIGFTSDCFPDIVLDSDFLVNVSDFTLQDARFKCTIQPCPNNSTTNYSEVSRSLCAYLINQPLGGGEHNTWLDFCDEDGATCTRNYRACWQLTPPPITFVKNYVNTTYSGSPACSSTPPSIPPSGYTFNDEWPVYCFVIACE